MEGRNANQIAATETDINTLYGLYLLWSKNEDIDQSEFMDFIQSPSIDREAFLDEYCNYEFIEMGNTLILKFALK